MWSINLKKNGDTDTSALAIIKKTQSNHLEKLFERGSVTKNFLYVLFYDFNLSCMRQQNDKSILENVQVQKLSSKKCNVLTSQCL